MTQKTTKWRTLPVFISSTFKDMDAERDMLKKIVVPKLTETLKSRRIELKIIDLRWGVNTGAIEENERESLVLKVCLDSIRNNRPFFVALLGERYGWTPSRTKWENVYHTLSTDEKKMVVRNTGKSVTELEILFGALGNVSETLSRSLFYFRKETSYCNMPEALFVTNFYERDEEKRYKLQNLKAQIRQTCSKHNYSDAIREYSLMWNVSKNIFEDVDFCGQMYEHLLKEIEDEIADCTIVEQDIDRYEEEANALKDFVYFLTEKFTGREHLIARLKNFVLNRSEALILTGFSGCGKSAVFCKLYQELQKENSSQHVILAHSTGITVDSQYIETMLQLWNRQLSNLLQTEDYEIKEKNKPMSVLLKEKFLHLSKKVTDKGYKLIILLDALDRFEDNKIAKYMQWLPESASLVATSLPTDAAIKPQKIHPDLKVEDIDSFTEAESKIMVARLCTDINKEISQRVLDALLSKRDASGQRACASPLWLQLVTNVLFGLDADDFREMRSRNESDEADKIEGFLCDLLDTFPADAGELFLEIINRAAKDFGHELTHKSMEFIAVSQAGLREKDLAALMGNAWDELAFASLRRWLGRLITEKGDNRRWTLAHHHLILALRKRLTPHEQVLHKSICNYLLTLPDDDPLYLTAMYHLIKADDKPRFALFYARSNEAINRILTAFYNNNHSLLSFLSDAAPYLGTGQRCDYVEKLVCHFSELPWTDYDGYINLCKGLFHWIDTKTVELSQQRRIGSLCQSITQWCNHKNDHENLFYFSKIQVDCFTMLIEDNPSDEELKNSLAIALSCMGDYYTATGDTETAMYYFKKLLTLQNIDKKVESEIRKAMAFQKMAQVAMSENNVAKAEEYMKNYYWHFVGIFCQDYSNLRMKMAIAMATGTMAMFYSDLSKINDQEVHDCVKSEHYLFASLSVKLNRGLYAHNPDNIQYAKGYLLALKTLHYLNLGKEEAATIFQEANTLEELLKYENPDDGYLSQFDLESPAEVAFNAKEKADDGASENLEGYEQENNGNYKEAMQWYQKGATKGNCGAICNIGYLYEKGEGVRQDYTMAAEWYKKAADKGSRVAMKNLGCFYEEGLGVPQDYGRAIEWYRKAAEKGNVGAMYNLAGLYEDGNGIVRDYEKAAEWYLKAADNGDEDAMLCIGIKYWQGQGVVEDYAKAKEWFIYAAYLGCAQAMHNIGCLYNGGYGVNQDYVKAAEWYEKAAERGYVEAMYTLGVMYRDGKGVTQDYAVAMKWFKDAATQEYVSAMYHVGKMYHVGHGVNQDYDKALEWYKKAAAQDGSYAYIVGLMYYNGNGVDKDHAVAMEWFKKAAAQGDSSAMFNIGVIYYNGSGGIEKDNNEAKGWIQKAAASGHEKAKDALQQIFK